MDNSLLNKDTQTIIKPVSNTTKEEDFYRLAFFGMSTIDDIKEININLPKDDIFEYTFFDKDYLKTLKQDELPDVLVVSDDLKKSHELFTYLEDKDVKIIYLKSESLKDIKKFQEVTDDINASLINQKMIKLIKKENKIFNDYKETIEKNSKYRSEIYNKLVTKMLERLKEKDQITYDHINNISRYVDTYINSGVQLDKKEIELLRKCAIIHDVGKLAVPNQILRKTGNLTSVERKGINNHKNYGLEIIDRFFDGNFKDSMFYNERYDGKGNPYHLVGEDIPKVARIIAVLDVYNKMMNTELYGKRLNEKEAIVELTKISGSRLDPKIVNTFIDGLMKEQEIRSKIDALKAKGEKYNKQKEFLTKMGVSLKDIQKLERVNRIDDAVMAIKRKLEMKVANKDNNEMKRGAK